MKTTLSLAALCLLGVQASNLESEKNHWHHDHRLAQTEAQTGWGGGYGPSHGLAQTEAEANTDAEYCGGGGCGDWGFGGYGLGGSGGYGGYGSYGGLGGCGYGASCWAETESETQVNAEA